MTTPLEAAEKAYRDHIEGRPMKNAIEAYLNAIAQDAGTVERVARATCSGDSTAPSPDSMILIGLKSAKAWEARIPQAQAALAELRKIVEG